MRRAVPLGLALCAAAACGGRVPVGPRPAPAMRLANFVAWVDSQAGHDAFRNAHWGILIVDPVSRDTLYSRNAGKLFLPASNQKLITGATALVQLGPGYRFWTRFATRGAVAEGILQGDLVVVGTGDPTFSDALRGGDHRNAFRAMAESLAALGVTSIGGALRKGGDAFADGACGFGWELDDLDEPYGACVDELFVNEGFKRVRRPRSNGDSAETSVAIRDPEPAFLAALLDALGERGISVAGGADTTTVPDSGLTTLFAVESPPLSEILGRMMKPSQNQIAEILFKTIGRERGGAGRADSARRVVERQLRDWGADSNGFAVRDGSGMSRHDFVSPETVVRVLDAMRQHADFGVFFDALPVAGVDGTVASRMRNTPAQGNVHAKTGTVDKARSLSGYVTTADGRMLIFSFLCNNFTVPNRDVERVQDSVLVRLASLPRPVR